jgi:hypothetical protein
MAENTVLDEEIFSFEDEDEEIELGEELEEEEVEEIEEDGYEELEEDAEIEEDVEENYEEPPSKKKQTPEENAKFAEMRRQSIIDQRVREELEKAKANSVEYKTTQLLAQMYGVSPEQLYKQIEDARVTQQAEEQGIPIEVARSLEQYRSELGTYQEKLKQLEFQSWSSKVDSQANELKKQFPMLTDDDIYDSKVYLLETIRNPNMPLEQAVFALHGAKITNTYKSNVRNEVLAEVSGRKKGALPPQTRKASTAQSLSQDEVLAAKALGVSIDDYLKFKD